MKDYVNAELRREVIARARSVCEYCLIHQDDTYFGCQVDHVIAEKHGGQTNANNLALSCVFCNRAKGTDIGSLAEESQQLTRFFNPRIDRWADHFLLKGAMITPLTVIGQVTARQLRFNRAERIAEREALAAIGRYPSADALAMLA